MLVVGFVVYLFVCQKAGAGAGSGFGDADADYCDFHLLGWYSSLVIWWIASIDIL